MRSSFQMRTIEHALYNLLEKDEGLVRRAHVMPDDLLADDAGRVDSFIGRP